MARRISRNGTPDARPPAERVPENGVGERQSGVRPATRRGPPTPEQIAARAYELFLERGGVHGYHHEDWVRAEQELRTTDPSISKADLERRDR
jgi:hypothetical protein